MDKECFAPLTDIIVAMADKRKVVEEGAGAVTAMIRRAGDLTSDLEVYCYTSAGSNMRNRVYCMGSCCLSSRLSGLVPLGDNILGRLEICFSPFSSQDCVYNVRVADVTTQMVVMLSLIWMEIYKTTTTNAIQTQQHHWRHVPWQ